MAIYRNGVRVKRPTTSSNSSSDEESAEKSKGGPVAMPHAHPAHEKGVKQPGDLASRPLDVSHSKGPTQRKRKSQSRNIVFRVLNGEPTEKKRRKLECNLSSRAVDTDLQDGDLHDGDTQAYQVGDSICHLPPDLMELEDLRPILSLQSWNFLLTEEERESLSAYLPDMDESTFKGTLTQLFAGSNFNFSSPMTDLLQQLKGGLCNPEIAKYREGLRLLQRKQHYHNMRTYHNAFVNTCLEMRSLWLSHGDAGLHERLKQWLSHKSRFDDSKAHYGESKSDIPLEQVNEETRRASQVRELKVINKVRDEVKVSCKQLLTVEAKQCPSPSLGREVDPGVSAKSKSKQTKVLSLEEHKLDFIPVTAETEDALVRNAQGEKVDVISGSKEKRWKDEISLSQSRLQAKARPSTEVNIRGQERSLQQGSWKENAGYEVDAERLASRLHNSYSGLQQSQLPTLEEYANGANKSNFTEIGVLWNGTQLQSCERGTPGKDEMPSCSRKEFFLDEKLQRTDIPAATLGFPFSVLHFISAVRMGFLMPFETGDNDPKEVSSETDSGREEGDFEMPYLKSAVPAVAFQELVRRVRACPGDFRVLERQEPLEGLVRGVLRVLSCKTKSEFKDWKALVAYNKKDRVWTWIGVLPLSIDVERPQISAEAWGIPESVLYKIQEAFASWLTSAQAILRRLGQLARLPLPLLPAPMDEKDRFRESKQQKGLVTINPTSDEMRVFFQEEEAVRYSFPEMAFFYTNAAGKKSAVAPLKRVGGKPNSKARDHPILKLDRPSHVTILCLVRDAAARLPDSTGTRADVCTLIRDSQYIVDDVCDAQLSQVVSGALDRLHYERDPCVRYDGDKKLWVYLHADRDEDDFEDNGTTSTKRSRRSKKEGIEQVDYTTTRDDQDVCDSEHENNSPQYAGAMRDSSYEIYPTAGTPELLYNHHSASLTSTPLIVRGQFQDDCALPFIDLPPSVQPACAIMQSSGGLGSIVNGSHNGYITLSMHL